MAIVGERPALLKSLAKIHDGKYARFIESTRSRSLLDALAMYYGRVNDEAVALTKLDGFCEKAMQSPWYFLVSTDDESDALDRMFDRAVKGLVPRAQSLIERGSTPSIAFNWFETCIHLLKSSEHKNVALQGMLIKVVMSSVGTSGCVALVQLGLAIVQTCADRDSGLFMESLRGIKEDILKNEPTATLVAAKFQLLLKANFATVRDLPISVMQKPQANMLFSSADWIGFDLDFTLTEFHDRKRLNHVWICVCAAFQAMETDFRDSDPILKTLLLEKATTLTLPLSSNIARCAAVDVSRGNLLRLDRKGRVTKVLHGNQRVSASKVYDDETEWFPSFTTVENDKSDAVPFLQTDFEIPLGLAFSLLVSMLPPTRSDLFPALFKILKNAFVLAQSPFFEYAIHKDVEKERAQLRDHSRILKWLNKLKSKGKRIFILSDAKKDHCERMLSLAYGPKWTSLFDLVITDASKTKFFKPDESTQPKAYKIVDDHLPVTGGDVRSFNSFTQAKFVLFFGDNPMKDVFLPSTFARNWRIIAVIKHLERDYHDHGLVVSGQGEPDGWSRILRPFSSSSSSTSSPKLKTASLAPVSTSSSNSSTKSRSMPLTDSDLDMGSSMVCDGQVPSMLADVLDRCAEFTVVSLDQCAAAGLFVE